MPDFVQLTQRWTLGPEIGRGGFGRVLEAVDEDGRLAAAKFIPKAPGADRELLFEDLSGTRYVVPIIDSGEWQDQWVLVMPRAEKSLRAHISEHGALPPANAVAILSDVATALADLSGRAVHRDLKPENILLLNGHWCLSDFGIARYAEASTAVDTHKWAWTAAYNAPERWRSERAVAASDVYSFGVLAFELMRGVRPFQGPDLRDQHLHDDPPALTECPALLASLVAECLFKGSDVRPTAANISARLGIVLRPASPAVAALQVANEAVVRRRSGEAAEESAQRSLAERRQDNYLSASKALAIVTDRLVELIRTSAPAARWQAAQREGGPGIAVSLGVATLTLGLVEQSTDWGSWKPAFQVIAHSSIGVRFPPDSFQYEGRSHSLWFCDAQEPNVFRWYETAFMIHPLVPQRGRQDPFALPPGEQAGGAVSAGMSDFQVAWPFVPLEPGNDLDFLERWVNWFALGSQGALAHPSSMPERSPTGSWRAS